MAKLDVSRLRLPVALALYDSRGGLLGDVSRRLGATWERSIRAIGGCWLATAEYDGSPAEMMDVFQNGMLYAIKESAGGMPTWEGFLASMTLTRNGLQYTRSWLDVANRIKADYSTVGLNLVVNQGCEAAVWAAYGTPPVRERSATWASEGTYSAHIVTDAANEGVVVDAGMTAAAAKAYQARLSIKVVTGTWRLEVYNASTGVSLDYTDAAAGESVMYTGVAEDALTAATSLGMRLYCTDATGECYADAAVFQEAPGRGETSWYNDVISQSEYGIIEDVLSLSGETDATAQAKTQRALTERAYARTKPPARVAVEKPKDALSLTFCGYAFTLRNKMTALRGTEAACSALIASSVAAAQFVTTGSIQTNSLLYRVEDRSGYRAWQVMRDVTLAGDAAGNRWTCGVYPGRRLDYRQADVRPSARLRGGLVLDGAGGLLEPWFAEPGYVALDDLPGYYDAPTSAAADVQRLAWFDEVVFNLGDYLEDARTGIVYQTGGTE